MEWVWFIVEQVLVSAGTVQGTILQEIESKESPLYPPTDWYIAWVPDAIDNRGGGRWVESGSGGRGY